MSSPLHYSSLCPSQMILSSHQVAVVDVNFTFTGMRAPVGGSSYSFPSDESEHSGISGSSRPECLKYSAVSLNLPHTHARASELLFLLYGSPEVGLTDMTNKLFTETPIRGNVRISKSRGSLPA
ncbi:Ribonuclease [Psidium guajava]|nr:Ribonuclease [Psidium guajava]